MLRHLYHISWHISCLTLISWHKILSWSQCENVCPCRSTVWLSTAPTEPVTRWHQVRCLLQTPLFAKLGQTLSGTVLLAANNRYACALWISPAYHHGSFGCLVLRPIHETGKHSRGRWFHSVTCKSIKYSWTFSTFQAELWYPHHRHSRPIGL